MTEQDIRWEQRFSNYKKAVARITEVVEEFDLEDLSELEVEGVIQRFEYTYELAWNTLQDLFKYQGYTDVKGPNTVLEQAFKDGLIEDAEGWKELKQSRQITTHTYDSATAEQIAEDVVEEYHDLFKQLEEKLEKMVGK